ncbi:hypothetical protein [Yinghuangia soli]|uniref:Uncharacterized protein n=1 Tax=Yinghuangia soli TaxID=2908204 RepID=A0AA41Q8H2_9ACTN|nr:hypothetical protein [Yinghuangia soli]MCF2533393.1 hypothetical protein [Yinghuangia soli]
MDIIPEVGVASVKLGDKRADVERRTGDPVHGPGRQRAVYRTTPSLVVHYHPDGTVELVELGYSGPGRGRGPQDEVWFDGVQLTYRFLDEVVAELHAKGYTSTESGIGHNFHAGFAVWSMGSLSAAELDPDNYTESEDDEDWRDVAEGVSVAPYSYFTGA